MASIKTSLLCLPPDLTRRFSSKRKGYDMGPGSTADEEDEGGAADDTRQSVRSSTTNSMTVPQIPSAHSLHGAPLLSSISSAKGSTWSRRMSNNLFGSGKFRDQAYLLRTAGSPTSGSPRLHDRRMRPTTPEDSSYTLSGSAPSSPGNVSTNSNNRAIIEDTEYSNILAKRLSRVLSPEGFRRASPAFDKAIRELEEEGDEKIVMERSPITHVPPSQIINGPLSAALEPEQSPISSPADVDTGTALSFDDLMSAEDDRSLPHPASRTTSPTPRLPDYTPGMLRPMTPRGATFDSEDLTPSTTPRANTPRLPGINTQPQSIASSFHRHNPSTSSSYSGTRSKYPATPSTAPLFFNRSMNGRYTPEERQGGSLGNKPGSPTKDSGAESPVLGRRRPMSPLSGPSFQPISSSPPSRATTPSNITWHAPVSPNGTPQKSQHTRGHSRNNSSISISDQTSELEQSKSQTSQATSRSLRSPALPDSPWVDGGYTNYADILDRPESAMSGMSLGSPMQTSTPLRTTTPTNNGTRSPTNAVFADASITPEGARSSRRSSRQTAHASTSTFSLGSVPNALLFPPLANSSRPSLESAGSSYHTWDEDHKADRLHGLFSAFDPDASPWHDVGATSTAGTYPYDAPETEEAVKREIGLSKSDFAAIQDKLVGAALVKAATPENRRPGSIRRRRPSTSQSNYSFNGERTVNSTPQPPHVARANALLDVMVDSIDSPTAQTDVKLPQEDSLELPAPRHGTKQSSPMRRNRALADALFGAEDSPFKSTSPAPHWISIMPDFGSDDDDDDDEPLASTLSPTKPLQMHQ
ncbi:uncharacterized protein BXZ73DRAFT_101964 [Epithele typhae]|uniref:uncharacterized protein n=1 Tax=Epithele typhae TaxID=378194 RepID=UPI002007E733|nr:uncharacterized protein BXZ73DRAFT_101964 [Epithele typhae]KAH9929900.1 hypothetical protein BXZ73DRAFT_101964 [Epithele typhae]